MPLPIQKFLQDTIEDSATDPNVRFLAEQIRSNRVARLKRAALTYEFVTCTSANTNYAAAGVIPTGTGYLVLQGTADCVAAIGEATSGSVGLPIGAGTTTYPVEFTPGDRVNVRSTTAGAVLTIGYQPAD